MDVSNASSRDAAATPTCLPPLRGRVLGAYRLITELGSGGMGSVWFGEHVDIGRRAAIKVLHPHIAEEPELVRRFLAEARAVNAIRHPNIGDRGELPSLVMELLEGETLGERLEARGRLPADEAVRVASESCAALAAAHDHGIVHRDLKPENVFLARRPDGPEQVKLLDFGIAKLLDRAEAAGTRTGMIPGDAALHVAGAVPR